MPFSPLQVEKITAALNSKIKKPCPECEQSGMRRLLSDVVLFSFYSVPYIPASTPSPPTSVWQMGKTPPPPYPTSNQPNMGGSTAGALLSPPYRRMTEPPLPLLPTNQALPCIVLVCGNCGFTEFYNIHVLGVAGVLGFSTTDQGTVAHG